MANPFDPLEYLRVARELAKDTTDDAKLRVAVGRAYYAVFLLASQKAQIGPNETGKHEKTKTAISRRDLGAGSDYQSLKDLRVQADYFLLIQERAFADWKFNWKEADQYASSLIEFLEKW